jgi:methanogenic corrinoid protein MtbC1
MPEPFLVRYLQPLLAGRRAECFELVANALRQGVAAETLICDVVWPAMAQIERLYRDDRLNAAGEHMAGRINRSVADQLQTHLHTRPASGKRVVVACADGPHEELGAQMVSDLLQADGWEVYFVGGGVPDDEIVALLGELRPHILLLFGATPEAVPNTRLLVERLREIGTCPTMNVVVTGGIFSRADGLWREIGADAYCDTPQGMLTTMNGLGPRVPRSARVGVVKKRHRRRKTLVAGVVQPA